MTDENENNELQLNSSTLEILKQFAIENGANMEIMESSDDILSSIHSYFSLSKEDRKEIFNVDYSSHNNQVNVHFEVEGVKRELGQTLNSTGLTIWRAAEHLCQYIVDHREIFSNQSVCELGSGLGMVSILLDKAYSPSNQSMLYLSPPTKIIVTDGDEDTIKLLQQNILSTQSNVIPAKLYWGKYDSFVSLYPIPFDIILAADVIYEQEQVVPLVHTVEKILSKPNGVFYLAFARRNVPIDYVLVETERVGLIAEMVDEKDMEPIYAFRWRSDDGIV